MEKGNGLVHNARNRLEERVDGIVLLVAYDMDTWQMVKRVCGSLRLHSIELV